MKKIGVSNLIILFSIVFIGLNPTIFTYALCAIKDTPNAIFNLLYVMFLLQIVRNYDSIYNNKFRIICLMITILLVLLLRNNGIYTFILSFPFLIFIYKFHWKKITVSFLLPIILFGIYDRILLPRYNISDSSIRETMSIPVMQLARLIHYKSDVFSDKDVEIVNKVFNFELMGDRYNPDISDSVKNLYNKNCTEEDLKDFFMVWLKILKKYPGIYISSLFNSTYGYLFPLENTGELYLYDYKFKDSSFFDIDSPVIFNNVKNIFNRLISIYYMVPFFMNKVAYYSWLLIFSGIYVIKKKKYKYLIPLLPLGAVFLSCIASPLNGSFRYILPIIFSVPMIISIDYLVYKECLET